MTGIAIWTHPAPTPAAKGEHDRDRRDPEWTPGKGETSTVISAGDTVGKPSWSERLRKHQAGDRDMGQMTETVLEGWKITETAPRKWSEDKGTDDA